MNKKGKEITKISDLIPDANNYNKGTEFGSSLITKSIQKNGLGRSLLLDKNGKVIAGNKTLEGTVAAGFNDEDIIVVKTDGTKLVVVQRTDLDLDTKRGKEMALADNATAKANLAWDYEMLGADFQTDELQAWGVFADEVEVEANDEVDKSKFNQWADSYLNNSIRQVVLYYDVETHERVLQRMQAVCDAYGIEDDNSAVVLKLLEFYESKK